MTPQEKAGVRSYVRHGRQRAASLPYYVHFRVKRGQRLVVIHATHGKGTRSILGRTSGAGFDELAMDWRGALDRTLPRVGLPPDHPLLTKG